MSLSSQWGIGHVTELGLEPEMHLAASCLIPINFSKSEVRKYRCGVPLHLAVMALYVRGTKCNLLIKVLNSPFVTSV